MALEELKHDIYLTKPLTQACVVEGEERVTPSREMSTYMYTYIHTYIHTYTYICICIIYTYTYAACVVEWRSA